MLQIPKKSYTSLWGQLLTTNHLPSSLQSLPPEPLSKAIHVCVLSWASQVLHWKKVTIMPFSMYEERLSGFLSMKPETYFRSWKLLQNQQPSLWLTFQRHWLNSQKAVVMLAVIKRAVPKKNKNSPPTKFYWLSTWDQKTLQRVRGQKCPPVWAGLPSWNTSTTASHQLYFSVNVLMKRADLFSLNELNLSVSPASSYCFNAMMPTSFL